jgi:tripartite-type tricarboxylate transporter receptor subunit TctC
VPTFEELGIRNFRVGQWHGLFAPAKTPDRFVRRAHAALVKMFDRADVKETVISRGSEIMLNTPEQFAQVVKNDLDRYGKILRAAGVEPQ